MDTGSKLVIETVDLLIENEGNIKTIPQEELYNNIRELCSAPKIFKETCHIDWEQTIDNIYNFIRGLSPYPTAWTEIIEPEGEHITMKIFQMEKLYQKHNYKTGTIHTDGKNNLDIAVSGGFICIKSLQLAGKKRLPVKDFLNGTKINDKWYVE